MDSELAAWLERHELDTQVFEENGLTLLDDVTGLSGDDMAEIGLGPNEVERLQTALATDPPGAAAPPFEWRRSAGEVIAEVQPPVAAALPPPPPAWLLTLRLFRSFFGLRG